MVDENLVNLVGRPAPEVYSAIIAASSKVREVAVAEYTTPPMIQNRAELSAEEQRLLKVAGQARQAGRLSYLEILLEKSTEVDHAVDGILDAVAYHQRHAKTRRWVSREDVMKGRLIRLCAGVSAGRPLALLSRVRTNSGCSGHIPLLDLHLEKSGRSIRLVAAVATRLLGNRYAILETGRSYHLVGTCLLNEEEARHFLSRAILFSPITDHAYIAHQLLEGESALRITGCGETGDVPTLVAVGGAMGT